MYHWRQDQKNGKKCGKKKKPPSSTNDKKHFLVMLFNL